MNLIPFRSNTTTPVGLSDRLIELSRYGKPRVSHTGEGWHASVEMNTNATGTSFAVRSRFDHESPDAAVAECAERVRTALAALGAN